MTKITEQRLSELNCSTITDREVRKLVKAYRKAKYPPVDEGWIEWGGDPDGPDLPRDTMVNVRTRNGDEDNGKETVRWWKDWLGVNNWTHEGRDVEIIAYRIAQ